MTHSNSKSIYVCGACGRTAKTPYDFKDVSCAVNATLCDVDSLVYDKQGIVIKAIASKKPTTKVEDK